MIKMKISTQIGELSIKVTELTSKCKNYYIKLLVIWLKQHSDKPNQYVSTVIFVKPNPKLAETESHASFETQCCLVNLIP